MLFALGFWLWAMPGLLVIIGVALVIWLMMREVRRQGEKEIAQRKARRAREMAILRRADEQHNLRMQGDPRGVYGDATSAVKLYEEIRG